MNCNKSTVKMCTYLEMHVHTDLLSICHVPTIPVVSKQSMRLVRQDHAMACVVLVNVIQELVQTIGNQVLVFETVY